MKKREQTLFCTCAGLASPVDLTCETCGRSSIEGMRHSPENMLDSSNLEFTNCRDHELTWKVKKGFRSSSRRPRKPVRTLNVGVQHGDKSSRRGKPSVAESEKLGVAVLGRRFAEKPENVPIKKRKPLLQSPSIPPRTPSPHREESLSSQPSSSPQPDDFDQKKENKGISTPWWFSDDSCFPMAVQLSMQNDFVNRKRSKVSNGKLGYTEDFSGIALLAAAACDSSIRDDVHEVKKGPTVDDFLMPEGIVSSMSATPFEKTTSSSESANQFLKESMHEESIDDAVIQDKSVVVLQNSLDKGETAGKSSSPKKDVRLHWDLNTVMEAWELPSDDVNTGSQRNGLEDTADNSVRGENPEKLEGCASYREPVQDPEQLKYSAARAEVSTQVISKDKSLDTFLLHGSEPISNRALAEQKINSSPTSVIIQTGEASSGSSATQLGQKVFMESVDLGKHDVCTKTLDLLGNRTSPTELVSSATCQMSDEEYYASKCGNSGHSNASPVHGNSGIDATFGEGQPVVAFDVEKKQDKAPTALLMDSSFHCEMKELTPTYYECFGKVDLADPIDDRKGFDVSHGGLGPTDSVEKMSQMAQIEGGYESPFEDGELRESVAYSYEENDVDGETECVDYYSDCRDGDEFNAASQCMSKFGSDGYVNGSNGGFPVKELQCGRANPLKESNHSSSLIKCSGQYHLPEGFECSTGRTCEANNIGTEKIFASESMEGHLVVGSSAAEVGSRASRGIFSSNFEGTSCSDALQRKHNVYMQRARHDTSFQAGRTFGSEKYLERDRPLQRQNQGDSRNYYQTGYTQGTRYPRPRSIANSGSKIDGLTFHDQRRFTNYSSKDEYRPIMRQRSPAESDDGFSASRRMVAARENIDHNRSRGRGRIYGQGFSRVPREEYDGPMSNNPASFSTRPRYFSRRERSFSPILGRGASFSGPRRNSRSRSRSRSPLTFRARRDRNMVVRRLSRSPEFRSDARMGRGRMPFQKSNYAADEEDGLISPPRTHFSPQRHPRWINDENRESNNFVDRKPPGRLFGARQKFDLGGSRGRTKSDECFRPMMRAGRFTEHADGGDREHNYNGGNRERTKYHDKFENIEKHHGMRHCNTSGAMRRFRIDEKGCSMLRNTLNEESCIKGTDRRDIQRSAREGRSPFRYSSERMYASGPNSSRICDSNDDVTPSRG